MCTGRVTLQQLHSMAHYPANERRGWPCLLALSSSALGFYCWTGPRPGEPNQDCEGVWSANRLACMTWTTRVSGFILFFLHFKPRCSWYTLCFPSTVLISNYRAEQRRINTKMCSLCSLTHTFSHTHTHTAVVWCCWWMAGSDVWMVRCRWLYVYPPAGTRRVCVGSSFVGDCSSVSRCSIGYSHRYSYSMFACLGGTFTALIREFRGITQIKRVFTGPSESITSAFYEGLF